MERTYWRGDLTPTSAVDPVTQSRQPAPQSEANLVSSLTTRGRHMPVIDLDLPARLVPSSTAGHFHLFIDAEISWREYKRLLRGFYRAGLIERGFYKLSLRRRATFARTHPKGVRES